MASAGLKDNLVLISSDGHASARMADYRPYLDPQHREAFDNFLPLWEAKGARNFEEPALASRMDPDFVNQWKHRMLETGRVDGNWDPRRRLNELDQQGIAAEVLFPDFGLPFELYSPSHGSSLGHPPRTHDEMVAGARAYNRWLVDFVSAEPKRFAPMAHIMWDDVGDVIGELRRAKDHEMSGVILPSFSSELPLFHPHWEPVWNTIEELELVANSHLAISSTRDEPLYTPGVPHSACAIRVMHPEAFFLFHNLLSHLIWGGVLERHPGIPFVFTESGSEWIVHDLSAMDHAYDRSYFRSDVKDVIRSKPSEYYERQCFLGSSIFSLAEVEARHLIGIDKMMIGMDYPHHEGTFVESTRAYVRATFGAAEVPLEEARRMLGGTAGRVFGFDALALQAIANELPAEPDAFLRAPTEELFPRGDVHKPGLLSIHSRR